MKSSRFAAILRVLNANGPCTPHQIAEHLGIPFKCLYGATNYLAVMLGAGQIHISTWDRQEGHGGPPIPIYAAGSGRSERRPKSLKQLRMANKYPPPPPPVFALLLGARP